MPHTPSASPRTPYLSLPPLLFPGELRSICFTRLGTDGDADGHDRGYGGRRLHPDGRSPEPLARLALLHRPTDRRSCEVHRRDGFRPGERQPRDGQRPDDRPARLLRLHLVQPEHAGPPQFGRSLRRETELPVPRLSTRRKASTANENETNQKGAPYRAAPLARQPQPDLAFSSSGLRPGSGGGFDASGPASA